MIIVECEHGDEQHTKTFGNDVQFIKFITDLSIATLEGKGTFRMNKVLHYKKGELLPIAIVMKPTGLVLEYEPLEERVKEGNMF